MLHLFASFQRWHLSWHQVCGRVFTLTIQRQLNYHQRSPKNVRAVSISSNKIICRFDHCYLAPVILRSGFLLLFLSVLRWPSLFSGKCNVLKCEQLATNDEDLGPFARKLNVDHVFLIRVINNAKDSQTDRSWIWLPSGQYSQSIENVFFSGLKACVKMALKNPCP